MAAGRFLGTDPTFWCTCPGQPWPDGILERVGACIGEDLSDAVLHRSPEAGAVCARLGAAAFAWRNHVFLQPSSIGREAELALLSHELAHVAQQRPRRARPADGDEWPGRAALEAEADEVALAVRAGRKRPVRLADRSGEPACWNLAGHYYLPYLMFLNAGVDPQEAKRIALWCWLPDQVEQFDAAHVGTSWAKNFFSLTIREIFNDEWHEVKDSYRRFDSETYSTEYQFVQTVHRGLHVFTGGDGQTEAQRRADIFLGGAHMRMLYRGISLHAFGDCFSHRRFGGTINVVFQGHPGNLWSPHTLGLPIGHGLDGHDSDDLWHEERWAQVCAYIRGLGRLANAYAGREKGVRSLEDIVAAFSPVLQGAPRVRDLEDKERREAELAAAHAYAGHPEARAQLIQNTKDRHKAEGEHFWPHVVGNWKEIDPVAKRLARSAGIRRDEDGVSTFIRQIAADLLGRPMEATHPKFDPVPWKEYAKRYSTIITQDAGEPDLDRVFYLIQKYAVEWSGMPMIGRPLSEAAPQQPRRVRRVS